MELCILTITELLLQIIGIAVNLFGSLIALINIIMTCNKGNKEKKQSPDQGKDCSCHNT